MFCKIEHKHITKYLNLSKLSISWQSFFFLCIALFHVMYCRLICKSSQKYAFEVWKSYIHICIWMNAYIYTCQPHNSVHVFISCFSRMSNEKSFEYEPSSEWIFVRDSRIIIGGTFIKLHVFLLAWFELDRISKLHKRYYYTMFDRQTL